ncbi:Endocytosis and vacuole integrity protein, partial [Coemansia sp. RSA 1804]
MATTNLGTLLANELQSLSTEARRKHPDVKEAAERVIIVLRGIKSTSSLQIASELAKSEQVIRPFVLACKTSNQKLVAAAVQCMQLLISHQAISPGSIRESLNTLNTVLDFGVDIQVKVLQMVLPLVSRYSGDVYGETLVEAFHTCISLQRSRDPIVSNTAAAMLRQIVVSVFDRVVAEDRELGNDEQAENGENGKARDTSEQDMTRRYAKDAFFVLQDLCLLAADSEPIFIRDSLLDKGLVLELLESVLVNHAHVVARHTAMAQILRERLAPFFVNFFAEKAPFPLVVRSVRIVWLLIRYLHQDFLPECEIFLSVLTRLIDPGSGSASNQTAASNRSAPGSRRASISGQRNATVAMLSAKTIVSASGFPMFYRVLAMEVVKNVMRSPELLHQLYLQYDGQPVQQNDKDPSSKDEDCHVVRDMISAVSKVANERPDIRADSAEGIPSAFADGHATEPTSTTSTGATSTEAPSAAKASQVGAHNSCTRIEMHQLLDKQDPPNIPDTYLFYLSLLAIAGAVDGISAHILATCSKNHTCSVGVSHVDVKSSTHQVKKVVVSITESVLGTSIALESKDARMRAISDIAVQTWPMLLSAYSFFLGVRLDDELFNQTIDTMQKFAQVCGALGLVEARNAVLTLMCRSCLPQTAIVDHEKHVQSLNSAKSSPSLAPVAESAAEDTADASSLDSGETTPKQYARPLVTESLVGLSFTINARQVQCLRAIISCAIYLAPVLGPMWYPVVVTMQQAEEVLYQSNRGVQTSLHGSAGGNGAVNANGTAAASNTNTGSTHGGGRAATGRRGSVSSSAMPTVGNDGSAVLAELFVVHNEYAKLFSFVRMTGNDAFTWVVRALCLLGSDLSSVPIWNPLSEYAAQMRGVSGLLHRRISAAMNRPTFAVEKLRDFAVSNIDLLLGATTTTTTDARIYDSEMRDEAWSAIMYHLLGTATFVRTPSPIRTQSCEALSDVVIAAMELVSRVDIARSDNGEAGDIELGKEFAANVATGDIQLRILTPLSQMMTGQIPAASSEFGQFIEVRKLALDTLHRLLQASGHSIKHAWSVVFDIIHSVLEGPSLSKHVYARGSASNGGSGSMDSKHLGQLMRSVFPCLQLICTDYLEDLPAHCLRRCIESLGCFGRQTEDLNISLTAIGQAWALFDFLQAAHQKHEPAESDGSVLGFTSSSLAENNSGSMEKYDSAGADEVLNAADKALEPVVGGWWSEELGELDTPRTQQVLWVLLLHSLSVLGRDSRHEVRLGAIQTLFRALDMHGDSFGAWEWDSIIWAVVLPLVGYALEQRAYIFELISDGRLAELPDDTTDFQASKAQMASKSGVFVEDPALLYSKQWDETAATTLQGAAKTWSDQAATTSAIIWRIGFASQAWCRIWRLVDNFLVGRLWLQDGYLPSATEHMQLKASDTFVSDLCKRASDDANDTLTRRRMRPYLRTRNSVAAAIDCASVLIGSESRISLDTDAERLRIAWVTWLSMTIYLTSVPDSAGLEFNKDVQDRVVVTQDVLGSLLSLCATIVSKLCGQHLLEESDCVALIATARRLLVYVDAPLAASDIEKTTPVQGQLLKILDRILEVSQDKEPAKDGNNFVSGEAAIALVLSELSILAVAPYVVTSATMEDPVRSVLANNAVYKRAASVFSAYYQRVTGLDSLQDSNLASSAVGGDGNRGRGNRLGAGGRRKQRVIRATFIALGEAALKQLGQILCVNNNEGPSIFHGSSEDGNTDNESSSAMRVLLHGIWQDAVVAIGWHLVVPLAADSIDNEKRNGAVSGMSAAASVASDWFVRVVPEGMKALGRLVAATNENQKHGGNARVALADAWMSVGSFVGLAVGMRPDSLARAMSGATRASAGSTMGDNAAGTREYENVCAGHNRACKPPASPTDRKSSDGAAGSSLSASTRIEILDSVAIA